MNKETVLTFVTGLGFGVALTAVTNYVYTRYQERKTTEEGNPADHLELAQKALEEEQDGDEQRCS